VIEREQKRIIPGVFVHVGKGTLQGKRIKRFRKAWAAACQAAGRPGVLLHDLRRSGVRSLIRCGVPERVALACPSGLPWRSAGTRRERSWTVTTSSASRI
jgi:integrase